MSSATLDDADMKESVTLGGPNGHAENPYLSARRQWNSDVERAFHSSRLAWAVAFACLFIVILLSGGLLYYAGQPRLVPYVIAIDEHGQTTPLRPADRANALEGLAVRSYLADWIRCARQVTPHIPLQQQAIDKVFSMLRMKDPAKRKIDA
jgi:type IV secretion system protein TrbF